MCNGTGVTQQVPLQAPLYFTPHPTPKKNKVTWLSGMIVTRFVRPPLDSSTRPVESESTTTCVCVGGGVRVQNVSACSSTERLRQGASCRNFKAGLASGSIVQEQQRSR